jgi:hypothetical protein
MGNHKLVYSTNLCQLGALGKNWKYAANGVLIQIFTKGKTVLSQHAWEAYTKQYTIQAPVIGYSQAPAAVLREGRMAGLLRLLLYQSMKTILSGTSVLS